MTPRPDSRLRNHPARLLGKTVSAVIVRLAAAGLVLLTLAAQPTALTQASPPYGLLKAYFNLTPSPNEEFGNAVAFSVDGTSLFVAARGDTLNTVNPIGSVSILTTASGAVSRVLSETSPVSGDYFGYSLAISGTETLVGAQLKNTGAPKSGAAFLYNNQNGAVLQSFAEQNPSDQDYFGTSVAILSDTAVLVGVPQYSATDIGRAYVCLKLNGDCSLAIDRPSGGSADGALFGSAMVSLGDKFAVSAPADEAHGMVYIYTTTTAALYNTITLTNPHSGDYFGGALAAVNGNLLIGAQTRGTSVLNTPGAAYLYAPDGTLVQTFNNPDAGDPSARFGAAVAGDGDLILIGAPGAHANEGRAYLFSATTGALIDTFKKASPATGDQFGNAVAMMGESFVIGAPDDSAAASAAGAVYRFGPLPPTPANLAGSSKAVNAASAWSGSLITYTLTLTNSGTIAASFALTDTLDPHVSLVTAPGLTGNSTLTATGVLTGLAQLNYQVVVHTGPTFNGVVANIAQLSGDGTTRNLTAPMVTVTNHVLLPFVRR